MSKSYFGCSIEGEGQEYSRRGREGVEPTIGIRRVRENAAPRTDYSRKGPGVTFSLLACHVKVSGRSNAEEGEEGSAPTIGKTRTTSRSSFECTSVK
jgi:hypothetical protein